MNIRHTFDFYLIEYSNTQITERSYQTRHIRQFSGCSAENEELHIGDFDGDGLNEVLCHQM